MENDLNSLPPYSRRQCFGVHQPVNAWSGAGDDIFINSFLVGDSHYQIGWSASLPEDVYFRKTDEAGWTEWGLVGVAVAPQQNKGALGKEN